MYDIGNLLRRREMAERLEALRRARSDASESPAPHPDSPPVRDPSERALPPAGAPTSGQVGLSADDVPTRPRHRTEGPSERHRSEPAAERRRAEPAFPQGPTAPQAVTMGPGFAPSPYMTPAEKVAPAATSPYGLRTALPARTPIELPPDSLVIDKAPPLPSPASSSPPVPAAAARPLTRIGSLPGIPAPTSPAHSPDAQDSPDAHQSSDSSDSSGRGGPTGGGVVDRPADIGRTDIGAEFGDGADPGEGAETAASAIADMLRQGRATLFFDRGKR